MALISIDTAIKRVLLLVAKIEPPRGVEMLTCNRGIAIIRLGEDSFLARVVKVMAKREFPRSRQVRIFSTGSAKEFDGLCSLW